MKDPAFMFYPSDFLTGCLNLTMEERGQYITLLCIQHQTGHISDKTIRLSLGSVSVDVMIKFKTDENGLYYNERLDSEIDKRNQFIDSRRNNGILGGRPKKENKPLAKPNGKPTHNLVEDEDEDDNIIKDIEYLYILYPSKCIVKNCSTGKTSKDKDKIKTLLKKHTKEELKLIIETYVSECKKEQRYMKNFSTFLNNLPDYSNTVQSEKIVEYELMGAKYKKPEHIYLKDVSDFGDKVKLIKYS